jgi:hypothetical protein
MAVLKPQVIVSGIVALQEPRASASANGVVVARVGRMFWTKRWAGLYIKNMPSTAVFPHKGQIETRINFGTVASSGKGSKGFVNGLPAVAALIQQRVKGYHAPDAMPKEDYPSRKRRTYHTIEDLKKMLA